MLPQSDRETDRREASAGRAPRLCGRVWPTVELYPRPCARVALPAHARDENVISVFQLTPDAEYYFDLFDF